jgi:hypothetical protein
MAVCDRIVAFASADPEYKNDVLLAAGYIEIPGDAAIIMQLIDQWLLEPFGFTSYRMYEPGGFIPPDEDLTHAAFVAYWAAKASGLAFWASHGSSHCAFAGDPFVCGDDAPLLAATEPGLAFSSACSNANFSATNNLGTELLRETSAGFIGSTDVTHPGNLGEGSLIFFMMLNLTLNENRALGPAMNETRERYMALFFHPGGAYDIGLTWRNFFGFTLLGDPALRYWANQ